MKTAVYLFTVCAVLLAFFPIAFAQPVTLALGGGSVSPGSSVALPLSIANGGNVTSGVEWTLTYSPSDFSAGSISAASVETSSNKQLTCNNPTPGHFNCMAWGLNATGLSDGVLAVVNLTAAATVSGNAAIALSNSLAASPNAQPISVTA